MRSIARRERIKAYAAGRTGEKRHWERKRPDQGYSVLISGLPFFNHSLSAFTE
jgi:hypothetical protein